MKTIVLASANKGKIREIAEMLPDFKVVGYKQLGLDFEIEENGKTFYENALIKAKAVSEALSLPALADDSGLEVDGLNGAPGIYSARYSESGLDKDNNDLLLKNLEGKDRNARFVCCMVYYYKGKIVSSFGQTEGEILYSEQGENGFGYDPLFYSKDLKKCLGVATDQEKNSISHRSRALKEIIEKLKTEGVL